MSNNQMPNDIESRILNSVSEGLNTGDFSSLKETIKDSVNSTIKEAGISVSDAIKSAGDSMAGAYKDVSHTYSGRRPYSTREETQAYARMLQERRRLHNEQVMKQQEADKRRKELLKAHAAASKNSVMATNGKLLPANFNPVGQSSSTAMIVGGSAGVILGGYAGITGLISLLVGAGGIPGIVFGGIMLAGSVVLLKMGAGSKNMLNRAKRYAQICGENMYAQLSSLSSSMGISPAKVKKDIKKMLRKGYFPEGYLDDEETTLMLSTDIYKQYQVTKRYALSASAEATVDDLSSSGIEVPNLDSEAVKALDPVKQKELKGMVTEGMDYIKRLHALNDDIPGEIISNKLYALESILKEIFDRLLEHPEQMERMHKTLDYYLPTMIKLVEAYAEYDKVSSPGSDIIKAKEEIEDTLDTINEAFIQLLNNLFKDSVWDVTTDAQVLKTILKQEGLTQDLES